MNRRDFLRGSLAFSMGSVLLRRAFAEAGPVGPATRFVPLRRDTGYFTGRGGTIGYLAARDALVVVDTQFPDTAFTCLKGLPGAKGRTLDATINTHHHLDHTAGNVVFKPASKALVAHERVPALQFEAAKRAQLNPNPNPSATVASQVYADVTFSDVWRREIGSEIVTAEFRGPAHTGGDAVVIFEKANVIHMGDLVFNRLYPVVDRPGGATLHGWIHSLEECAAAYPADAIYIFGHGSAAHGVQGVRGDLLVMRDFLSGVLDYVGKAIAQGKPKETIVALDNLPGFPDYAVPLPNRLGTILGAAFDELTQAPVSGTVGA